MFLEDHEESLNFVLNSSPQRGAPTSHKHVCRVGFVSRLSCDAQGVKALVFLVEVRESQRGAISTPVHVGPFRRRHQNIWIAKQQRVDIEGICKLGGQARASKVSDLSTYRLCTTGFLAGSAAGRDRWWPYNPDSWSRPLSRMIRQTFRQCGSGRWCRTQKLGHLRRNQWSEPGLMWRFPWNAEPSDT